MCLVTGSVNRPDVNDLFSSRVEAIKKAWNRPRQWGARECENRDLLSVGRTPELQQFLPYKEQELHITTCGTLVCTFCLHHSTSVSNLHCTDAKEAKK